jgi:hypothetical protein
MRLHIPLIGIAALLLLNSPTYAQRAPAIPGVTGTLVTPETAKDEKKAEDKAAVAVKDVVTREDKGPLADLIPGMTVVIRYKSDVTEGIVEKRSGNEITVRYANKKTDKLELADKSSANARAIEYAPNGGTAKVIRYFKLKS